ncbi:pentatricopeptide repeat-containing protein, partial [Trifolium medium]|nr:pentatricopeptide repeat-containing protein [Trifolium medium]
MHMMYDPRIDKYRIAVLAVKTVFDPGGATFAILGYVICRVLCKTLFRLWWMPWDRGRK